MRVDYKMNQDSHKEKKIIQIKNPQMRDGWCKALCLR